MTMPSELAKRLTIRPVVSMSDSAAGTRDDFTMHAARRALSEFRHFLRSFVFRVVSWGDAIVGVVCELQVPVQHVSVVVGAFRVRDLCSCVRGDVVGESLTVAFAGNVGFGGECALHGADVDSGVADDVGAAQGAQRGNDDGVPVVLAGVVFVDGVGVVGDAVGAVVEVV